MSLRIYTLLSLQSEFFRSGVPRGTWMEQGGSGWEWEEMGERGKACVDIQIETLIVC